LWLSGKFVLLLSFKKQKLRSVKATLPRRSRQRQQQRMAARQASAALRHRSPATPAGPQAQPEEESRAIDIAIDIAIAALTSTDQALDVSHEMNK